MMKIHHTILSLGLSVVIFIMLAMEPASALGAFSYVGSVTLNSGEDLLTSAGIDAGNGLAYFGTYSGGKLIKIELGVGTNPPVRLESLQISDTSSIRCLVVDDARGYGYIGPLVSPGKIITVNLGSVSLPMVEVSLLTLPSNEEYPRTAVIDTVGGHAYFGTGNPAGGVVKIKLIADNTAPVRLGKSVSKKPC